MFQNKEKLSAVKKTNMKYSKADFETWTFCLPPKRQLSILLNLFLHLQILDVFFSSWKLQYCRTIVLANKLLKLFKTPLFQKRRWSCDFPSRKSPPVAQKHRAIFRQEKMAFSTPVKLSWNSAPPPPESLRADVRAYVTSEPKFSRIDSLPNLVSNGAPLASFTRGLRYKASEFKAAGDKLLMNKFIRQNFGGGLALEIFISWTFRSRFRRNLAGGLGNGGSATRLFLVW